MASARWRPEKKRTMAASVATLNVSAPIPNRRRPAAIPGNPVPSAVTSAPAKQSAAVNAIMRPAPKRSTIQPPTRSRTTFGRL